MVLLLTNDLFLASHIQSAARAAGVPLRTVASVDQLLAAAAAEPVTGVLLDLEMSGADLPSLLVSLPRRKSVRIIAYGPHVHVGRLEQARAAGCDEVLSRGALHQQLPAVLTRLAGGLSAAGPDASPSRDG